MQAFGFTRSARRHDYLLQTPDTFVRAPLPGMNRATAIVHAVAATGAKFMQFTVEFEAGGTLEPSGNQRFLYVLNGEVELAGAAMKAGGYAWCAPGSAKRIKAMSEARLVVIEKPYLPVNDFAIPQDLIGSESSIVPSALLDDPAVSVGNLLPADRAFDMAVNTMTFLPGGTLPMVEIHVMEHGLLMLEGAGIYRLGDHWHPVSAGDFIWMAPYLPQWFGALGKVPAKYLIYKDWNR